MNEQKQVSHTDVAVKLGENVVFSARSNGKSILNDLCKRASVDVALERQAQDKKWGEQNHPDFSTATYYGIYSAAFCRDSCQNAFEHGEGNWYSILLEEVAEAGEERDDPKRLREELVQIAAVAQAWIEAIDRRTAE